ncbi:MAG: 5-(carboxyamino)imidazole ribonucleotide synthase [Chloroflexota bacterium]
MKIGILGSGQLGRMLAQVARQHHVQTVVYSPGTNTPAGQVADVEITAAYDDLEAIREFAKQVDVITYEFENVPLMSAMSADEITPVHPNPRILAIARNRVREKSYMQDIGIPVAPFHPVNSLQDLEIGLKNLGAPAVLKTAEEGYDGKGQVKINDPAEAEQAWQTVGQKPCVLEGWITFEREISVLGARDQQGGFTSYGPIENDHVNHILDVSMIPAELSIDIAEKAILSVQTVMEKLNLVGLICIEFFVTTAGKLIANEIAPRPHNSGHLTIEGHVTSQFEQQMRTIIGWPVGDASPIQPACGMANLLGNIWPDGDDPDWQEAVKDGSVKLHHYGKAEARPGRKMGHLTTVGTDRFEVKAKLLEARARL